jgi:colanic acid biosynthesis glycosyl transferase WcaI
LIDKNYIRKKGLKKKITIIGINYYPEDTAIGLYTSQLASYFNDHEFDVTVITGFPYYPNWKISSEYESKKTFYKETIDGITVHRYKQYVPKTPSFMNRAVHLLDFSFGTFINLFKIKEVDVVLCIVPFIGSVFLAKILAKIKNAKLWVHVQDFEFDAVLDSNIINNKINKSWFFNVLFWVEAKLLNSANMVSTISSSMLLKLDKKITKAIPTRLLPNWVDLNFINPKNYKTHSYLESSKFKILYAGNIGEKQDWNLFLEFAKILEIEDDVEIIVVGNGSKREWLAKKLSKTKNISLYNPVPYSDLSDLMCSADLHILFQKSDVIDTVMPSKILAMMASEKPSLIMGNLKSEVALIVNKSKAGTYLDSNKLFDAVKFVSLLKSNKSLCDNFGEDARIFASINYSKNEILNQFITTLRNVIK